MTPDQQTSRASKRWPRLWPAVLETVGLFGLLGWVYVAVVAATDTGSLDDPLIRWLPLRIDTAGAVSFAASALGFLLLNARGDGTGTRQRRGRDE